MSTFRVALSGVVDVIIHSTPPPNQTEYFQRISVCFDWLLQRCQTYIRVCSYFGLRRRLIGKHGRTVAFSCITSPSVRYAEKNASVVVFALYPP